MRAPWWPSLVIAAAILPRRCLCYAGTTPIFVAYGVAMCGIGMLTLTGNTISMDVFGPVADNANGIGEMGYDKDEMEKAKPGSYKRARQILADLDAVGNTTKAVTKGIAIGSAVIAAVSLFASFIAVIAVGSEEKISQHDRSSSTSTDAGKLTVADPMVFIGMLIGGAVPFLFSSMMIRAVGRAAYLHRQGVPHPVPRQGDLGRHQEARLRPRGRHLHQRRPEGTDRPRPAGHRSPRSLVGFLLGPYALGGFLAGMILVGPAAGRLHGQRRRRLGQRQEDDRGRAALLRRQGLARRTRPPSPATPSAIRSRTPPARPSTR